MMRTRSRTTKISCFARLGKSRSSNARASHILNASLTQPSIMMLIVSHLRISSLQLQLVNRNHFCHEGHCSQISFLANVWLMEKVSGRISHTGTFSIFRATRTTRTIDCMWSTRTSNVNNAVHILLFRTITKCWSKLTHDFFLGAASLKLEFWCR